ncbi:hypothetical protein QQ045_032317 [Rhodiola kirilowii]
MLDDLLSYHGNMMLAGVVSLLLVILFTLLLHIFGRRCLLTLLANPNDENNNTTTASSYYLDHSTRKGLGPMAIASIPVFVYEAEKRSSLSEVEECAICLSGLEDGEMGRRLQSCGHAFHVECIDMWLCSHFSCPICRSLVIGEDDDGEKTKAKIKDLPGSHDAGSSVVGSGTDRSSDSAAGSDLV